MNKEATAWSDREFICSWLRSFLEHARGFPFCPAHALWTSNEARGSQLCRAVWIVKISWIWATNWKTTCGWVVVSFRGMVGQFREVVEVALVELWSRHLQGWIRLVLIFPTSTGLRNSIQVNWNENKFRLQQCTKTPPGESVRWSARVLGKTGQHRKG